MISMERLHCRLPGSFIPILILFFVAPWCYHSDDDTRLTKKSFVLCSAEDPAAHQLRGESSLSLSSSSSSPPSDTPVTKLSNGRSFPLIGIGVGNLQRDLIGSVIHHSLQAENAFRLIDTARASRNEKLIFDAVQQSLPDSLTATAAAAAAGGGDGGEEKEDVVHVITKVWYTHLGYQRTTLSVNESLSELHPTPDDSPSSSRNKIKVHILLHWPRCDDRISWMDCQGEEDRLPQYVKDAGPPPHLDKANAWKESWKALEDLYDTRRDDIESIGISNFDHRDMGELLDMCRIKPHIIQNNVWAYLFDPFLMTTVRDNGVVFQAYNVMNGILHSRNEAPNAYMLLERIGRELGSRRQTTALSAEPFSPSQVVLGWLTQDGVSVIPRASRTEHQVDNSPRSIAQVPKLIQEEREQVKRAVSYLLKGQDMEEEHVTATFFNAQTDDTTHIDLFWTHVETGEEIPVKETLKPGEAFEIRTHPGHAFVAYDNAKSKRKVFEVSARYGGHEHFAVEL